MSAPPPTPPVLLDSAKNTRLAVQQHLAKQVVTTCNTWQCVVGGGEAAATPAEHTFKDVVAEPARTRTLENFGAGDVSVELLCR